MNMKRLALICVFALVVIGCVVAAGCISTTAETTTTTSDDQIIGTWVKEDGSSAFIIVANNDGTYYTVKDDAVGEETPIIWKNNSDGTYALINGTGTATVTLDTVKGQFTTDSSSVFVKLSSDSSGSTYVKLPSVSSGVAHNNFERTANFMLEYMKEHDHEAYEALKEAFK